MIGRYKGMWPGLTVLAVLAAAPACAGELTVNLRLGSTVMDVGAAHTSSGDAFEDSGLMAAGWSVAYRWPKGLVLEATGLQSFDPFPIFGWEDLEHYSVGAGWQFDLSRWWRFTPKAGMTYTELSAVQEDFWEGNEPVDKFSDLVPFVEAAFEGRIAGRFGIGLFLRENFEKFGESRSMGVTFGWTFQ